VTPYDYARWFHRVPRVLFLNSWDGEDYGVQYLLHGFYALLGKGGVIDWPYNPFCRRPDGETPTNDATDMALPHHILQEWQIVSLLRSHAIDLVVISSARDTCMGTVRQLKPWLGLVRDGIVITDYEDDKSTNYAPLLSMIEVKRKTRVLFKRETPDEIGQAFGFPMYALPFGYPAERMTSSERRNEDPLVFYHAHDWGWPEGNVRERMVRRIENEFPKALIDVGLSEEAPPRNGRLALREYHERQARAKVGIALNEGGGSDNNRYWEAVAAGCVLLSDKPRHAIPNNFTHDHSALFYNDFDHAMRLLAELRDDDKRRMRIAEAGQRHMREHHTTIARAFRVLRLFAETCQQQGNRTEWWNPNGGNASTDSR
jgi:hypothetical protein